MSYSKDFIRKVLEATNLVELISESGVSLKRAGANYKGICPFHSEKTPSFNVNPLRGYFYCFGCKISGDAIKFLIQYNRLTFIEAVEKLAQKSNIPLEKESKNFRNRNVSEDVGLNCLWEAASFFVKKLNSPDGKNALEYLRVRNVSESMMEKFNLGNSPNDWQGVLNYLKQKKKLVKDIYRTGLIKFSDKSGRYFDTFRGRLMFPIKDINGRCIGFGARSLKSEDKPKYLNSSETRYYQKSKVLYGLFEGLSSIRKLRRLIFVEGYLDVIRLHENGFNEAVATCGTVLTQDHFSIIKRYADNLILIFDGDLAGEQAALKHSHLLLPQPFESYIVSLPDGEDPDSFLLNYGKENFERLLKNKITALDYLVQQTLKKFPDSIQGRMESLGELLPTLGNIRDLKRRQLSLIAISERIKISPDVIAKELQLILNKSLSKININDKLQRLPNNSKISKDEQWLLQSLLRNGNLWPRVRDHLRADEFQTDHFRIIYAKLLDFPDSEFKPFDPLKLENSDPKLFQSLMLLLEEEIGSHDFGLSLVRIKERNLELNYQEWLLKTESKEERAKLGSKRRIEEKQIKDLKQIFDNISTF